MEPASLFAITAVAGFGLHKATESSDGSVTNDGNATDDSGNPGTQIVNQQPSSKFVAGSIVFPVLAWRGVSPTRSQEYRKGDHHGCDLMYLRENAGGQDRNYPASTPNGSKMFFMPDDQWAVAAADGSIWSTGVGPTGIYVVLDHGKPFATFYVHFDQLDPEIPMGIQGGKGKIQVKAGQRLGRIGYSPRDAAKLKHLHFEVWSGGAAESHVDPWPFISDAPRLSVAKNAVTQARVAALIDRVSVEDKKEA